MDIFLAVQGVLNRKIHELAQNGIFGGKCLLQFLALGEKSIRWLSWVAEINVYEVVHFTNFVEFLCGDFETTQWKIEEIFCPFELRVSLGFYHFWKLLTSK